MYLASLTFARGHGVLFFSFPREFNDMTIKIVFPQGVGFFLNMNQHPPNCAEIGSKLGAPMVLWSEHLQLNKHSSA